MTPQEITSILNLHALWLKQEEGGSRANLSKADLRWANLSRADLSRADLRWANLSRAVISVPKMTAEQTQVLTKILTQQIG